MLNGIFINLDMLFLVNSVSKKLGFLIPLYSLSGLKLGILFLILYSSHIFALLLHPSIFCNSLLPPFAESGGFVQETLCTIPKEVFSSTPLAQI